VFRDDVVYKKMLLFLIWENIAPENMLKNPWHSPFKEQTGEQKAWKFEDTDLGFYKPVAKCAAFLTSKDRILRWLKTFQYRYYETLKYDDTYLIKWINHVFQDTEIKIFQVDQRAATATSHTSQDSLSYYWSNQVPRNCV